MSALEGRLAVIGAGSMGRTILAGLLAAGVQADQVVATARSEQTRQRVADELGVETTDDNAAAVREADVVLLATKPAVALRVAEALPVKEGAVLVSVVAGLSTAALEQALPNARVVRAMPNTAAAVGESMTGLSAGATGQDALPVAEALLGAVGRTVVLPEDQQDLVVATSGSGIAYLYLVAEAMVEAGVTLGLARAQSSALVRQTFAGAAAMLGTEQHPTLLREQVTSPGGTTAAAIAELEAHGVRTALLEAMRAARDASAGLG